MGIKHISTEQLVGDTISFAKDCIKAGRGPMKQLSYNNGATTAEFDNILFQLPQKTKSEMYWESMQVRSNQEMMNPSKPWFIQGYNDKARELGLPSFNFFGELIIVVTFGVVLNLMRAANISINQNIILM